MLRQIWCAWTQLEFVSRLTVNKFGLGLLIPPQRIEQPLCSNKGLNLGSSPQGQNFDQGEPARSVSKSHTLADSETHPFIARLITPVNIITHVEKANSQRWGGGLIGPANRAYT